MIGDYQLISDKIIWGGLIFYFAAFFLAVIFRLKNSLARPWALRLIMLCGLALNLAGWLLRWKAAHAQGLGYIPLANSHEALIFWALATGALSFLLSFRFIALTPWCAIAPFTLLALAGLEPKDLAPMVPALKSNWLLAHAAFCFLAYAAFFLAALAGLSSLLTRDEKKLKERGDFIGQLFIFGFIFLSCGIIFGAIWAERAWGRFWGWDPKETWSLITWAVYALALHLRKRPSFSGRLSGWLAIIGFLLALFTYFGVGRWLSGLHSYGSVL